MSGTGGVPTAIYRCPAAAAASALSGTGRVPLVVGGKAFAVLAVLPSAVVVAVVVRGPVGLLVLQRKAATVIAESRQTRLEVSVGDSFVLAGSLPRRWAVGRRGRPLHLGQHPMARLARGLGMAGRPVATLTVDGSRFRTEVVHG
ncbi:MAG TPA: hypothetical protein VGJ14_09235 [Sporichthyaceae bacterium]|jgi:hypothetical protein